MRKKVLCKNLKLTIEKLTDEMEGEQVLFKLEDTLNMTSAEICYEVNVSSTQSRRYHVKEAIVIGLRQLVDQAVEKGLIDLSVSKGHGVLTNLNMSLETEFPTKS